MMQDNDQQDELDDLPGDGDDIAQECSGWSEFICLFDGQGAPSLSNDIPEASTGGAATGGVSFPAPNSTLWKDVPLENSDAVFGASKDVSEPEKAKALTKLGVSPLWIEHILNGTVPKMDVLERRKIIEEAVEEAFKRMTDELIRGARF